jgi:hypothetical protein
MKQEVFRDRLLELTLARLERAEKLLERVSLILPQVALDTEPDDLSRFGYSPEWPRLARDVAAFLEEGK